MLSHPSRNNKKQVPFAYAQGRLSTPLRSAQDDKRRGWDTQTFLVRSKMSAQIFLWGDAAPAEHTEPAEDTKNDDFNSKSEKSALCLERTLLTVALRSLLPPFLVWCADEMGSVPPVRYAS